MLRRVVVLLAALTLLTPTGAASAHDEDPPPSTTPGMGSTPNMHLVGHVNPGPGATADVYGHRGHAYLASFLGFGCRSSGIRVYDLSDPTAPRHVSTFADKASDPSLAGTWTEKVIVQRVDTADFHGDLAVVSFQACDGTDTRSFRGFGLYDVTDPAHPRELSRYTAPGTRGSHEIWLGAHAGTAYVYTAILRSELTTSPDFDPTTGRATTPGRADFRIVDVSSPSRPRDVGEWGAWRELGITPWTGPTGGNFAHSVRVDERQTIAYLSYWDLGTVILDIANKAHPRYLGRTSPTQGATHSAFVAKGGHLLMETHELFGRAGAPMLYDITDPAAPRRLADFTMPGLQPETVHDPKVRGDLAYFSWYSRGVVVANIADPAHPSFVGQFTPADRTGNPDLCPGGCVAVWGVFLLGSYILASDMNTGLYVIQLDSQPVQAHALGDNSKDRQNSPDLAAAQALPPQEGQDLPGRWSSPWRGCMGCGSSTGCGSDGWSCC
jgi:hypothetical protein